MTRLLALAAGMLLMLRPSPVRADGADPLDAEAYPYGPGAADLAAMSCPDAMVWGQRLRDREQLVDAHHAFQRCAAIDCLDVVRRRCTAWASEVNGVLPRVRVHFINVSRTERAFARIVIDGTPRPEARAGASIPLDPGPHRIAAELADGRVTVREVDLKRGEVKTVDARFAPRPRPRPREAPPPGLPAAPAAPSPPIDAGIVVAGIGFGVGGTSAIASVVTGTIALARQRDAAATCATGSCSDDEIATGRRFANASTGTLVVAIVGTAVGTLGLFLAEFDEDTTAGWPLRFRF